MIIRISKLLKILKEKNIMISRSSLLRWESHGKIPRLYKSPGGWRYADEKYIEEVERVLKSNT